MLVGERLLAALLALRMNQLLAICVLSLFRKRQKKWKLRELFAKSAMTDPDLGMARSS